MSTVQEIEKKILKKKVLVKSPEGDYTARVLLVEKIDTIFFVHVEKADGTRERVRYENVTTLGQLLNDLGDRVVKTVAGVVDDAKLNEVKMSALTKVAEGEQWAREQKSRLSAAVQAYREHGK